MVTTSSILKARVELEMKQVETPSKCMTQKQSWNQRKNFIEHKSVPGMRDKLSMK